MNGGLPAPGILAGHARPSNIRFLVSGLPMLALLVTVGFPSMMAIAASSDLLTMTIANRVSILLAFGFPVLAVWAGMPGQEILFEHVACGAAVLVLTFVFFACGWIGGGDAKLAAATALWLGTAQIADYGLAASLLGAVLTLAILQFRRVRLSPALAGHAWMARLHNRRNGVPYGVALAAAGLILYPQTHLWRLAIG